ncbi:hypothetical protein S7335_3283 [Synechococcus sp. PCC 7335]|uniref:hypothetical protein n=1 Tax=Synechococcus sp. (strain ATCC 29403 / PCC 7335) TaxID=91464 RepID=UPI00017EB8AB|nr:hypothetical protein [Synechococcus sp. PCC 7335]EDX85582.1 hypothetical protein S7335_3283 [Synechococcus sp. PCC 7335]
MNSTKDTLIFLAKVLVSSAALSVLIKFGGPLLPVAGLAGSALNWVAIALIITPALTVAIFLWTSAHRRSC